MQKWLNSDKGLYLLSLVKKVNTVLFGLIATFLIHRILTPEMKGEFEYINNIVVMLTAVLNLGVSLVLPNYVRKKNNWTLSTFYVLCLFQFLFLTFGSVIIGTILSSFSIVLYGFAVACGVFSLQMLNNTMIFNFKVSAIANIIGVLANAVFLFCVFIIKYYSINIVFIAIVIKELICGLICFFAMSRTIHLREVNYKEWPQIMLKGLIPMVTSLLVIMNYKVDILELKWLGVDAYSIGIYSVGLSIADYVLIMSDVFKDVLFNKTASDDNTKSVNFALRVCSSIMIIAYICIVLFGNIIISILYGKDYLGAYNVTIIVMFGTFSMMYYKLLGTLYVAQGKWWFYFLTLLGSVLINIGSNIILIRLLGIYGAAITSLISYSFAGIIFVYRYIKTYKLKVRDVLLVNKNDVHIVFSRFKGKNNHEK